MKHATRIKLVITGTGFEDELPADREGFRSEEVYYLAAELRRRHYLEGEVESKIERELLFICEGCGAEYIHSDRVHTCAACGKEICHMCGFKSPRGHRLWYCEEHA